MATPNRLDKTVLADFALRMTLMYVGLYPTLGDVRRIGV